MGGFKRVIHAFVVGVELAELVRVRPREYKKVLEAQLPAALAKIRELTAANEGLEATNEGLMTQLTAAAANLAHVTQQRDDAQGASAAGRAERQEAASVDGGLEGAQHLNDVSLRKGTSSLRMNDLVAAVWQCANNSSSTLTPAIAWAVDEAGVVQLHLQMALRLKAPRLKALRLQAAAPKGGKAVKALVPKTKDEMSHDTQTAAAPLVAVRYDANLVMLDVVRLCSLASAALVGALALTAARCETLRRQVAAPERSRMQSLRVWYGGLKGDALTYYSAIVDKSHAASLQKVIAAGLIRKKGKAGVVRATVEFTDDVLRNLKRMHLMFIPISAALIFDALLAAARDKNGPEGVRRRSHALFVAL